MKFIYKLLKQKGILMRIYTKFLLSIITFQVKYFGLYFLIIILLITDRGFHNKLTSSLPTYRNIECIRRLKIP